MKIISLTGSVLGENQQADYFGIGRTTFFAMMKRDEEIAERYKRGKARAIGAIAQRLISKARSGDTASMIFYLKTQAGWRETAALEHSGAVEVQGKADRAFAEFAAILDAIASEKNEGAHRRLLEMPVAAVS